MSTKFYKKFSPDTPFPLSPNQHIQFKTNDGLVGFFATNDPFVQNAIATAIAEQRGGITEIDWQEFDADYLQKKSEANPATLRRSWREELSPNQSPRSQPPLIPRSGPPGTAAVANVVAVSKSDIKPATPSPTTVADASSTASAVASATPATPPQFNPPSGTRRRAPKT